jgi:hypothetical protein
MTETPTLAQRLRATWPNAISDPDSRHLEAADALESQAAQIAEQAAQIEQLQEQHDVAAAEVERLMALAGPAGKSLGDLEKLNDDLIAAWNKRNEQQASGSCCAEQAAQIEALRAFATDIMEAWPMGGIDGADLQDIAEKHGLLSPVTMTAPCHEECNCTDYGLTPAEWASGHICYRKTALLRGAAAMAAKEPK